MTAMATSNLSAPHSRRHTSEGYLKRTLVPPLLLTLPTFLSGMGWMGNQIVMTDLAFALLTILMVVFIADEMLKFPRRFGLAGLALYTGVLMWFCYDYMTNWYGQPNPHLAAHYPPELIARAGFMHCLFVNVASFALLLPAWGRGVRLLQAIPEPTTTNTYFYLVVFAFLVGISPFFFAAGEPFSRAIYHETVGGRASGAQRTMGRAGNRNVNWGGYITQLIEFGKLGAILAVFYAMLVPGGAVKKAICWAIWLLWAALAFGTGTRGNLMFMAAPVVGLAFIKYQAHAAALFKKISPKAYMVAIPLGLIMLGVMQYQAYHRDRGFTGQELKREDLTKLSGNSMFSEGLRGYQRIPDRDGFFYDSMPGEMIVRPMPQTLYEFVIGPIPRALWQSKPVDPVWEWFNMIYLGTRQGREGTTISPGLVGHWYFRYGIFGVIQGALLMGWLAKMAERSLQTAQGRVITIMISLAVITWLLRTFRGWYFTTLYPIIIGGVLLYLLIKLQHMMAGTASQSIIQRNESGART